MTELDYQMVSTAVDANAATLHWGACVADKSRNKEATENERVLAKCAERMDAAVDRKLCELRKKATGAAAHSCADKAKEAELWLQVLCQDLANIKSTLAWRIILPNCK